LGQTLADAWLNYICGVARSRGKGQTQNIKNTDHLPVDATNLRVGNGTDRKCVFKSYRNREKKTTEKIKSLIELRPHHVRLDARPRRTGVGLDGVFLGGELDKAKGKRPKDPKEVSGTK